MANENIATMKADAKKIMSDLGNVMSHAKADAEKAKADVENNTVKNMQKLMRRRQCPI